MLAQAEHASAERVARAGATTCRSARRATGAPSRSLVDVALAHPGLVALLLAPVTQGGTAAEADPTPPAPRRWRPSASTPGRPTPERLVRVVGALAALAVLTLAAHTRTDRRTAWRPLVVATCFDALGHRRPDALPSDPDQVEA